ncbi:hypothetical protein PanWU01x14_333370 [Parasponia andersonii]|uniref:Uncharacterized protein n=1 Tax=Parasponia andersonii TaxID=3476 RepID=A0A2P5AH04_PARAD|nr:hypothetical protein PanWU01x14_333370 [Parasponia andersonii]
MVKMVEGGDLSMTGSEKERGASWVCWARFGAFYIRLLARRHMGAEKSVSRCFMGAVKVKYNGVQRAPLKMGYHGSS